MPAGISFTELTPGHTDVSGKIRNSKKDTGQIHGMHTE
jgi:hypothetical protein